MAAGRRVWIMAPVAWLAAGHQGGSGAVPGRIALVAVVVLAVGAFAVLQVKARSRRPRAPSEPRRRRHEPFNPFNPSDWRTLPLPYWPDGRNDEAPWATKRDTGPTGDTGILPATIRTPYMIPPGRRGPPVTTRRATGDL
jgi:hypothetical protein